MAFQHQAQSSRFELKYLVSQATAQQVREFVRGYLEPDDFTPEPGVGYQVHSVYLDGPDLALYRATIQGNKNRFKLRVRFYDERPESPAFLEIKRRSSDAILKERAAISRSGAEQILETGWADPASLLKQSPKAIDAHRHFCELCQQIGAQGRTLVSYQREAYMVPDSNDVRVTFDRQITSAPYALRHGLILPPSSAQPKIHGVVLELKFTDRFPRWMNELVQMFNLQRCSVPKYVKGLEAVRSSWRSVSNGAPSLREAAR